MRSHLICKIKDIETCVEITDIHDLKMFADLLGTNVMSMNKLTSGSMFPEKEYFVEKESLYLEVGDKLRYDGQLQEWIKVNTEIYTGIVKGEETDEH